MVTPYFSQELFQFLIELRFNNHRTWFQANKKRYEQHVRVAFLRFIEDFAPRLHRISPDYLAGPRSLFRISRDTRFSANKAPYKTHAAAQFRHRLAQDVHLPGFYIHLEPDHCFLGSDARAGKPEAYPGRHRPTRCPLAALAQEARARRRRQARSPTQGLQPGSSADRRPQATQFYGFLSPSEEEVLSGHWIETVEKVFRRLLPLNQFLSEVLLLGTRE